MTLPLIKKSTVTNYWTGSSAEFSLFDYYDMALTRNFTQTVVERVEREPQFVKALLDEAATLFLSGEPDTARLILRDLINATIGFEQLSEMTEMPSKSLHRMLSPRGNPSMDNLSAIFGAVRLWLKVAFKVHTIKAA